MTKILMTTALALAMSFAATLTTRAQSGAVQTAKQMQQIPPQVARQILEQVHQVIDTAVGRDLGQQIGQEMGRTMRDLTRQLGELRGMAYSFDQSRDFKFDQTDKQTKTLAIGATGELVLKNIVGDITVTAGRGRDATVEIVRVSRGKTDADAKAGLERVQAEAIVRGERGSVTVNYPNDLRPDYAVSVSYNVTAPAGARVTVDTTTGRVHVTGLQGQLNVNSVSGAIDVSQCTNVESAHTIAADVTMTDVHTTGRLDVGSASATLRLTNIKAERLTASVISGAIIAHDVQAEGANVGSVSGDIEYSGPVSARGRYEFQAHAGNVRLGLSGAFDLDGRTFSGSVDADPSLNLTTNMNISASDRRRSLRGTVGGGGAAIVATTFSGKIWVGRKLN